MNEGQNRIRLCIVEDHLLVRDGLANMISSQPDMEVVARCSTAGETLDALGESGADLILLDLYLAGDTGFTLLEQLPASGFRGRVLIVAGTVNDQEAFRLATMGVAGIVLKSTSVELLLKAIRKVSQGEVWYDQHFLRTILEGTARAAGGAEEFAPRERAVLRHLLAGLTNKEIGARMNLPESSVKSVIQTLFGKTGVRSRSQLVRVAMEHGGPW